VKRTAPFKAYYRGADGETRYEEVDPARIFRPVADNFGSINAAIRARGRFLPRLRVLVAEARHFYRKASYAEHCAEEELERSVRKRASKRGEKLSINEVKMRVKRHPRMREAYESRMEAEFQLERLQAILEAVIERGRDLQTLSANLRPEREASQRDWS
jgi:hypothetical protein